MASEPIWLTAQDVVAAHAGQLARFGGATGLKSLPLLESAVAAPLNLFHYAGERDVLQLGAHLARAIVKNHAFVDGNKRTATIALLEFLAINGWSVELADSEARQPLAELIEQLAAGAIGAPALADVLRGHLVPL